MELLFRYRCVIHWRVFSILLFLGDDISSCLSSNLPQFSNSVLFEVMIPCQARVQAFSSLSKPCLSPKSRVIFTNQFEIYRQGAAGVTTISTPSRNRPNMPIILQLQTLHNFTTMSAASNKLPSSSNQVCPSPQNERLTSEAIPYKGPPLPNVVDDLIIPNTLPTPLPPSLLQTPTSISGSHKPLTSTSGLSSSPYPRVTLSTSSVFAARVSFHAIAIPVLFTP